MKRVLALVVAFALAGSFVGKVIAGGVKYSNEDGDYVKLGGRIQLQYNVTDPDA